MAGAAEPAARAARAAGDGLLERICAAGCAGHVLDYDDTYSPGLVHASAPVAPVALLLGAELGCDLRETLDAYAAGFETTAAIARAGHPALYERGWHPTAVCGTVGAAVTASRLLGLDEHRTDHAKALALLRAGGLRAAFGSDGKSLQVGAAAAAGVHAARLAAAGAEAPLAVIARGPAGFEEAFGGRWPRAHRSEDAESAPAVRGNWIKAYPCCLATHSPIEAALAIRDSGETWGDLEVVVHPRARQAAAIDEVSKPLEAKFSIAYLSAFTLLHGAPGLESFHAVDGDAQELSRRRISIRLDPRLGEMSARIEAGGRALAGVDSPLGSPAQPMDEQQLRGKLHALAGERLDGVLGDASAPASEVVSVAGLG